MNVWLFIRGLIIGLSIAAPVGPIGVRVIRRTLTQGRIAGLVNGLGAMRGWATSDALRWINRVFGAMLCAFGGAALASLVTI